MGYAKISQGGICGTMVDVRLVAKYAIETLATSVILVHNHPSGNLNPSYEDDKLTKAIQKGLELLNIKLIDHLIISQENYFSYNEEGKLW